MTIRDAFWNTIDWIFPPACVECGKMGSQICEGCLAESVPVTEPCCKKCGKPLDGLHGCALCRDTTFHFTSCRAPFVYEGAIASGIKQLKFKKNLELAELFAKQIFSLYLRERWNADIVIPVPLSRERRSERGFNQSEWIARSFARSAGLPMKPSALQKVRNTQSQVGLTRDERQHNLYGAFQAEPVLVRNRRVLLIDDVMTTGSTFNECARVLMEAGTQVVLCLSVSTASMANHRPG